jgi:hypothetical protein
MKNWMNSFLVIVLVFAAGMVNGQDIFVKVKSGSITLNNQKLTVKDITQPIKAGSKLIIASQSVAMVRQGKKLIQLKEPKAYSYSQLSSLLKKQKESSASAYSNVLFSDEMQKSKTQVKSGAVTRGGGKAVNWQDVEFTLPNAYTLLANEVWIILWNEEVEITEVKLEYPDGKIKDLGVINGQQFFITTKGSGTYSWTATLRLRNESDVEPFAFKGSFRVPEEKDGQQMLHQWQEFLKEISSFDSEVQDQLKGAYMESNMHYIPTGRTR